MYIVHLLFLFMLMASTLMFLFIFQKIVTIFYVIDVIYLFFKIKKKCLDIIEENTRGVI